jgi:hypothetical protein
MAQAQPQAQGPANPNPNLVAQGANATPIGAPASDASMASAPARKPVGVYLKQQQAESAC